MTGGAQTLVFETPNIRILSGTEMLYQGINVSEPVVEWRCAYANGPAVCSSGVLTLSIYFRLQIGSGRGPYAFACAS